MGQVPPSQVWLDHYGLESWEWRADHDGDGFTAEVEYMAGTDPFDSDSGLFLSFSLSPTDPEDAILAWSSAIGATYELFGSADLTLLDQSSLAGPMDGDGDMTGITTSITDLDRYFFQLQALAPGDGDLDGLSAIEEAILGTNPNDDDTDGDDFKDGDEVHVFLTDPLIPDIANGIIRGTIYDDPNVDGNLTDGQAQEHVRVYLDSNFNGMLDSDERTAITDSGGHYEFIAVPAGVHHVRQELIAPTIQTFPAEAAIPTVNHRPDEITNYTHAAPGVGNFDVAYGETRSDFPPDWPKRDGAGAHVDELPSLDFLLEPIGSRDFLVTGRFTSRGSEFLSLPEGAHITLRFDEMIVDGTGPDFLVFSPGRSGAIREDLPERVEILVGNGADDLNSLGIFPSGQPLPVDLADADIPGPITFIKLISQNNGGDWFGFDLIGLKALNVAPPAADAHVVVITQDEIVENRDFGRYRRDLPPSVLIGHENENASRPTGDIRQGDHVTFRVHAFDDLAIDALTFKANGTPVNLDEDHTVTLSAPAVGSWHLEALATDSGGQTATASAIVYVLNTDGTLPFDPSLTGPGHQDVPEAPTTRFVSPSPGTVSSEDVALVASIVGDPAATSWRVEYALASEVDPYLTTEADPDYTLLASGTGNVYSDTIATMPLSTLPDGIYFVRVCAENSATRTSCFGQIIAKNVSQEDLRPVITLSSPVDASEVMVTEAIVGTIQSTQPLREWYLEYALADTVDPANLGAPGPQWTRFAEGTDTIPDPSILATFDATTLKNNRYVIRAVAWNAIGLGWVEPLTVDVTGEAKLGRNRLEYTDFAIEFGGMPMRFTRVYDSFAANTPGELGYGWSLKMQDPDLRETVPVTGVLGVFGATPFKEGTRVYLNAPTGERLGFTFETTGVSGGLLGVAFRPSFVADPGNYYTLQVPDAALKKADDGSVHVFFANLPYNPSKYFLTDPDGNTFTYHESRGLLRATDLNGNEITVTDNGILHSSGTDITFARDSMGRITSVTNPEGQTWSFAYDGSGNLSTVTDPEARVTTYSYLDDPAHYLDSITDPLGRMPQRFEYDPDSGRLAATIDEFGNRQEVSWNPASFSGTRTSPRGFVSAVDYDERGNVIRLTDPDGNITTYAYDDPDNPDLETSITGPDGHTWRYLYDEGGRLLRTTPPSGSSARETTEYNELGKPIQHRAPGGAVSNFTWDAQGNLTGQNAAFGVNFTVERHSDGSPHRLTQGSYTTEYQLDDKGRIAGRTDTLGYQIEVETDRMGRVSRVRNYRGDETTFAFDSRAVPIRQTDPMGNSVNTVENADGSYTSTDRNGLVTEQSFTSTGLAESYIFPGGSTATPTYNESGKLATLTDALGNTFAFDYDFDERMNAVTDATGNTFSATFNAIGELETATTASGKKRSFEYDMDRRLIAEKWHDPTDDSIIVRTYNYTYHASGRLTQITQTANGQTHTYAFTGVMPRPTQIDVTYHDQHPFRVSYQWGGSSNAPTSMSLTGGTSGRSEINATYIGEKVYELSWSGLVGNNNRLEYRRHPDASIASISRFHHGSNVLNSKTVYTYGTLGPIASIRHEDGTGALLHPNSALTFTRDLESHITSIAHAGDTVTIAYDPCGYVSSAAHSNAAYTDEVYAYDAVGNRLSSHLDLTPHTIADANRLTSGGGYTYTYDADGNVRARTDTSTGEITEFAYNHRNRLIEAIIRPSAGAAATTTVLFDYDFADRLISREINGSKSWLLYDRHMPAGEFQDGSTELSAAYFYTLDATDDFHATWRQGVGEQWFLKDQIGSIRGIVDATGAFVSWTDYDAFGNRLTGGVSTEPLAFAGRPYLPELQLYANRLRFYDPQLGRFTQPDPLHLQGGDLNLYGYVRNNPYIYTDPNGTFAAISYGQMLDLVSFYTQALCNYGNCLGKLYKHVLEGVGNLAPPKSNIPIRECVTNLIGFDPCDSPFAQMTSPTLNGGANNVAEAYAKAPGSQSKAGATGAGWAILGVVQACKGLTTETKPASCGDGDE